MKNYFLIFTALFGLALTGCGGDGSSDSSAVQTTFEDKVVIHSLSDPEGLHPTNVSDASATEIKRYIHCKLLTISPESLELTPWLATSLPELEVTDLGGGKQGMNITYELRPEARWDNGTPVTPADVEFSIKAILNPKVDAAAIRPYFDFVVDFKVDPENPRRFTIICNKTYMLWDHVTGNDMWVLPKYVYDAAGTMDDIALSDIADENKAAALEDKLLAFADNYNNIKFHREADFISGAGPYRFKEWVTNQRIVLERKDNWWGDQFADELYIFNDGPQTVVFQTINDMSTALTSLKAGDLDILKSVRAKDWVDDLPNSDKFNANFVKSDPPFPFYSYIGMNIRVPKFADKRTRQAIAHLVDADRINETLLYGLADRVVGPIPKTDKGAYNSDLKLYEFNVERAKELLAEAGWKDSNGNGIVDKEIDGQLQDFKIEFAYNQGNDTRKKVGIALKEAARQAGIDVSVVSMEWSVFLERVKNHEIEMWYGAWVFDTRPSDPKQIWHTSSYEGGSNYTGFGTAETDALIESIRMEMDPEKRNKLYRQWQEILHDEVPYVFLYGGKRRNAIHKRFTNLNETARDPGYSGGGLQLAPGYSFANDAAAAE